MNLPGEPKPLLLPLAFAFAVRTAALQRGWLRARVAHKHLQADQHALSARRVRPARVAAARTLAAQCAVGGRAETSSGTLSVSAALAAGDGAPPVSVPCSAPRRRRRRHGRARRAPSRARAPAGGGGSASAPGRGLGRGQAPNACYSRGHGRENSRGGGRAAGSASTAAAAPRVSKRCRRCRRNPRSVGHPLCPRRARAPRQRAPPRRTRPRPRASGPTDRRATTRPPPPFPSY